jgi:hypothetical protein
MKFRRKPIIYPVIDADQYKPGMEDGFEIRYQDLKKPHYTWEFQCSLNAVPVQVPFINTFQGKKFIRNDDWVVEYGNGRKTLIHDKEFNTTYEKVEYHEELDA